MNKLIIISFIVSQTIHLILVCLDTSYIVSVERWIQAGCFEIQHLADSDDLPSSSSSTMAEALVSARVNPYKCRRVCIHPTSACTIKKVTWCNTITLNMKMFRLSLNKSTSGLIWSLLALRSLSPPSQPRSKSTSTNIKNPFTDLRRHIKTEQRYLDSVQIVIGVGPDSATEYPSLNTGHLETDDDSLIMNMFTPLAWQLVVDMLLLRMTDVY